MPLFEVRRIADQHVVTVVDLASAIEMQDGFELAPYPGDTIPDAYAPLAATVTSAQVAAALVADRTIAAAEALAWARTGALPAALEAGLSGLDEGDHLRAALALAERSYAWGGASAEALRQALGLDDDGLTALWRRAAREG